MVCYLPTLHAPHAGVNCGPCSMDSSDPLAASTTPRVVRRPTSRPNLFAISLYIQQIRNFLQVPTAGAANEAVNCNR